jgi:autotransporter-associated beta strand protein
MTSRGFARGRPAARVNAFAVSTPKSLRRVRAALLASASFACGLSLAPALGAGLDIGPGQTHNVVGTEVFDYLNIAPTGTLDFGALTTNDVVVNDNGVDTTWSGLINSSAAHADKDDQFLVKTGDGTVTLQDLTSNGTEIHISNGTIQQLSGTNNLFILNVGSNVPTPGTATFNISGGTLNIGPAGVVSSPFPAMQVGHFGGTGIVNQTGGTVNFLDASSLNIGNQGGTGTYNISGGKLDFAGGFFTLGRSTNTRPTNSSGTLNISGDALVDVHSAASSMILGNREASTTNFTTATVNQTGGTLRIRDGATLYLSGKQSTTTYNLLGGALEIGGNALQAAYIPGGTYALNLGGGTIRTIGSLLNAGVDATLLADTTSTIDTNGLGTNWTGTITGTGSLKKDGAGTLTFSTLQEYTGTTYVRDGTLLLTAGGNIGASMGVNLTGATGIFDITSGSKSIQDLAGVAGSIVNLGTSTLTAGSPRDSTFAGVVQGSGGLNKVGTGTLTLAGANTYAGATNVNAGTLRFGMGGSITPTSALNVSTASSLDLGGAGAQTLTTANVSFAVGSNYLLSLAPGDALATGGLATIGGDVFVRGLGGGFSLTTDRVILTATGITGTFASIDDDMPFLNALLRTPTPTQQAIYFVKGDSLESAGTTPNEMAVGDALDDLPLGNSLLDKVVVLSVDDAVKALDSMSGEFHASLKTGLIEQAEQIPGVISDRIAQAFAGGPKAGGGGADLPLGVPEPVPAPSSHGGGIWIGGFGSQLTAEDSSGNAEELTAHDLGILGGVDFGSDTWIVGAGGGYSKSQMRVEEQASDGDVASYHAVAYAGTEMGAFRLHGGGAFSWGTVDTTRVVDLPTDQTLEASYNTRTAQAFVEASAALGPISPFAAANYINLSTDGYTETGGDAALTADASKQQVTFTTIGVRATFGNEWASLKGAVGWRHATGDLNSLQGFAIQGSSFTVAGVPIAESAVVAEAGVDFQLSPAVTIGVAYAGQFAADAQEHGARAEASLNF